MTDFKITPSIQPPQTQALERPEHLERSERAFELAGQEASSPGEEAGAVTSTASLVEQLRSGRLDIEGAVDLLIEQALAAKPLSSTSEALRRDVRRALTELVRDDPTLIALTSAMKR